jgi:protein-L-isoaspartate(D-aspartate) O-methyltransferase
MTKQEKEFINSLQKHGIRKEIIAALKKCKQETFFDQIFRGYFYSDEAIPIGSGEKFDSSISLARMINFLPQSKNCRILEIGTGSGYSTAVLSYLYKDVVTVEYHEDLALAAKAKLAELKISNVKFFVGDILEVSNIQGVFDGIIIFAACLSRPLFLSPYLKAGGLIVLPMGPVYQQQIVVLKDAPGEGNSLFKIEYHDMCNFSPLKGMY